MRGPVQSGIGQTLAVAPQLGDQAAGVVGAARQAFVDGWHQSMWVAAGLAVLAIVLLVVRGPKDAPATAETAERALAGVS